MIFVVVGAGMTVAYALWEHFSHDPVLLGRLEPRTRSALYGSLAATAGALLGLIIASLAVLLTLDDNRDAVREMQSLQAWRILHVTLLTAAGFLAATLAVATIALGVDAGKHRVHVIEILVTTLASVAFVEIAAGAIAFGLVVLNLTRS